jgi:Predicted secreted Zn-dependent protease
MHLPSILPPFRHRVTAFALAAAAAAFAVAPARAVTPIEETKTYRISGSTGAELYRSIGAHGPEIAPGRRTIAHTTFKLTWRRDYRPQANGSCVLATAVPKVIVTYTLPKPEGRLSGPLAASWQRFSDGLVAHEKVHGAQIVEMVKAIEAVSVGLSAPADPKCTKVRAVLQEHLKRLSDARVAEARAFDRVEMGPGGAVERLILDLVNGP